MLTTEQHHQARVLARTERVGWLLAVTMLLLTSVGAGTAAAQDLAKLSALLTPAYTAMSYARLCSMDMSWAQSQPLGPRGGAIHYAEHVKDEVIASLAYEDAVKVLKTAADAAREDARMQLRNDVLDPDKSIEEAHFRDWCRGKVSPYIQGIMKQHESQHALFTNSVEKALQSSRN
ncbi:hypothetical protein MXD81_53580 [Microbacteriaceae bacterium K1510]|nr:hypothetical protein [Microbacteriaceae bacterium K1510]